MSEEPLRGGPPADPQDEQFWGIGLVGRILCSVPLLGLTTLAFLDRHELPVREVLPFFVVLAVMTVIIMRPAVRLTQDELVIRHPIGRERIRRAEVASAKFNYFGLVIHKRDGGWSIAFLLPRWTSTELANGDQAPADSAAYQITQWAKCTPGSDS
jgi:hypothetical protein